MLACLALSPRALAQTGVRLLDQPAIAVKAPDRVVLVAVTRAARRLVAVGEHGVITISDDDGKTWVQASVPVDVTLTAVHFADARDGWAVGHDGVILHTADAGETWQKQLDGFAANRLTLAAARDAVAKNDPSLGTPHALARAGHFTADGPVHPFLAIWAKDAGHAIIFGAYRLAMITQDGGKTWADWSLHVGDALSHNLYDAAAVGPDLYLTGETGLVWRSVDGGENFAPVTSPGPNTLFEVLPTGDGGVLVCGVAGAAFRSQDHGASWQAVGVPTTDNLTAGAILASGAIVIGNESGLLFISRDHGRNFSMFPQPQPQAIFGLAQAPDGDLVVVGSGGVDIVPAAALNA